MFDIQSVTREKAQNRASFDEGTRGCHEVTSTFLPREERAAVKKSERMTKKRDALLNSHQSCHWVDAIALSHQLAFRVLVVR